MNVDHNRLGGKIRGNKLGNVDMNSVNAPITGIQEEDEDMDLDELNKKIQQSKQESENYMGKKERVKTGMLSTANK